MDILAAIVALVVLDILSFRFGADSRTDKRSLNNPSAQRAQI